jgi:hypothetical protein
LGGDGTPGDDKSKKCWKFGQHLNREKNRFFHVPCDVVQEPKRKMSYFQLFRLEEQYDGGLEDVTEFRNDLQKLLHPDRFEKKSEEERRLSIEQSALVTKHIIA